VARELTKLHEEIFRGPASAAREYFAAKEILGEITLVIAGAALAALAEPWDVDQVRAELASLLAAGELKKKDAARLVAEQSGWPAREVYRLAADVSTTDD
jgi:16S rRNA (cytidine1402-2'-O)-methyltransferase